jgi:hypothetical protein
MLVDAARLIHWLANWDFMLTTRHDTQPFIRTSNVDLSSKSAFVTRAFKGISRGIALVFVEAVCFQIAVVTRTGVRET